MADTIVLYASSEHLNSVLVIAKFITKHHPSVSIIIISDASESAADSILTAPSITYHRFPTPDIPPNFTTNPVQLLFEVPRLNKPNLKQYLQQISQTTNVKAFIIDFFCNSAFEVSTSLNIPTYFYFSSGGFGICDLLSFPTIDETIHPREIGELNDFIECPGCPPVHSSDFPKGMYFRQTNTYKHFLDTAKNMRNARGILVNTFDALEHRAKEALSNGLCVPNAPTPPIFFIAPLVTRIDTTYHDVHSCLTWLDSQPSKSVVFLCFGRRGLFSKKQLIEIATGLEKSGHRFLWSVRTPPEIQIRREGDPDLNALLPEGFLERTKERGFVIKTWAPQEEILSHVSVGGFVTHCGWCSVLEAVSFGVPMIGFPIYAEQRMNRVFMVEEIKVSLALDEESDGLVTSVEVEKRVRELMESVSGKAIRQRVVS